MWVSKRRFLLSAYLVLFGMVAVRRIPAQVAGGTISGTVTDASAGRITLAHVTIKDVATDDVRTVVTDSDGLYSAPNLIPGTYKVAISAPGFATAVKPDVVLTVGAQLQLDFQLTLGNVNQEIVVTAAAPQIDLSTSTVSNVVNETVVRELPLNARDWTALATLQPGVSQIRTQPTLGINNQRANRGLGSELTIGGNRPQQNNYRMDGVSINDYSNGAPGSVLGVNFGVDAIQEFSVVTSNATAEYGRSSGGIINAVTRSGTNEFHGSAYEFLRNSDLDARNFFDKQRVPAFKRNQFGGTFGAPIQHDKTFFFVDFEALRQSLGNTNIDFVPSAAARSGNLASGPITVSALVQPFLAFFPLPNGPVNGDIGQYVFTGTTVTHEDYVTSRLDHKFSDNDSVAATYMFDTGKTSGPDPLNLKTTASLSRRELATLEETHIFSPALVNSVRAGYSRVVSISPTTLAAVNPLVANPTYGFEPGANVGLINITGLTNFTGGLGAVGEYDFHYNSYQLYDDAFWTRGGHQLKFGFAFERIQDNQRGTANPEGQFIFGSLSAFLQDKPTSFNSPVTRSVSPRDLRSSIVGGYFQDDWKWKPNLTINLGLRYEMSTVPSETADRLSVLLRPTDVTPHLGSPMFQNPTKLNFEPRIGFAWDPMRSGKTSVRGAFGLYDVLPLPYEFEITSILAAPFFQQGNITNLAQGTFPTGAYSLLLPNKLRYAYIQQNPSRNYVMQWNFTLQRQISNTLSVTAEYAGSHGVHQLFRDDDFNIVLPASTPLGYVWPSPSGSGTRLNPNVGQMTGLWWEGSSIYHSLQTLVSKRYSHGLQFGASYTWAKSIDDGSASVAGDTFGNSVSSLPFFDSRLRRGLSDFDLRHNFVLSSTWTLPSPLKSGVLGWATNGWTIGGILQASTGLPFTGSIGGDPLGLRSADTFAFPDRLNTAGCATPVNSGSVHYIKTQCFAYPGTRLGNAGRNTIPGPDLLNLDSSLFKNNYIKRISESFNLQFRAEFFNVLNHTNFAPPLSNRALFTATGTPVSSAGLITSTATTSRQIQLALKVIF